MKKLLVLLTILSLFIQPVYSQTVIDTTWSLYYQSPEGFHHVVIDIAGSSEDTWVLAGSSVDRDRTTDDPFFLHIDENGSLLDTVEIDANIKINNIINAENNKFIISGESTEFDSTVFIGQISYGGVIDWIHYEGEMKPYYHPPDVVALEGGRSAVLVKPNTDRWRHDYFNSILIFDSTGQIIDTLSLDTLNLIYNRMGAANSDNLIFLTGRKTIPDLGESGWLGAIDLQGQLVWEYCDSVGEMLSGNRYSEFLYVNDYLLVLGGTYDTMGYGNNKIWKFDDDGDIVWESEFGRYYGGRQYICSSPNNTSLISSSSLEGEYGPSCYYYMLFDENGELLDSMQFDEMYHGRIAPSYSDSSLFIGIGHGRNRFHGIYVGENGIELYDPVTLPIEVSLSVPWPNPFNSSTRFSFDLPQAGLVNINLYDILGREVLPLINSQYPGGSHSYSINADGLSSGIYILRLSTGEGTSARKIQLVK